MGQRRDEGGQADPGGMVRAAYAALMAEAQGKGPAAARAAAALQAGALASPLAPDLALRAYLASCEIDPLDGRAQLAAAALLAKRGALAEARALSEAAFAGSLDQAVCANAAFLLGEIRLAEDRPSSAGEAFATAAALFRRVLDQEPADLDSVQQLARVLLRQSDLAALAPDLDRARRLLEDAATLMEALSLQVESASLETDLAQCLDRRCDLALALGDAAGAAALLDRLVPLARRLARQTPGEPAALGVLAGAHIKESFAAERQGEPAKAAHACDAAIAALAPLAARRQDEPFLKRQLARAFRRRGELALAYGDAETGYAAALQADALVSAAGTAGAIGPLLDKERAACLILMGDAAMRLARQEEAAAAFDAAFALCARHAEEAGGADPSWKEGLATAWDRRGDLALARRTPLDARTAYEQAQQLRVRSDRAEDPNDLHALAASAAKLGEAALALGDPVEARQCFLESLALRRRLAGAQGAQSRPMRRALAACLERLGRAGAAAGDREGARAAFEEELRLALVDADANPADPEAHRFLAGVHAHLAALGDPDAARHRQAGLARLEEAARLGGASPQDARLRAALKR